MPCQGLTDSMPGGRRVLQRYMGHCNVQTDIKVGNRRLCVTMMPDLP